MIVTEQYCPVVLFMALCYVILTYESVDEILQCGHSDKSQAITNIFLWCCLRIALYILRCDPSNERS